jgi:hypothetical protein
MDLDPVIRTTRALLKFCRDHQYPECGMVNIQCCLDALQHQDIGAAMRHFKAVPRGGMGTFDDWFPPVVFAHEDADYVWAVFEALVERWSRLMILAYKEAGKPPPRAEESSIGRAFRWLGLE